MKVHIRCNAALARKILDEGFSERLFGIEGSHPGLGLFVCEQPYRWPYEAPRPVILELDLRAFPLELLNATVRERTIGYRRPATVPKPDYFLERLVPVVWLYERVRNVRLVRIPVMVPWRPRRIPARPPPRWSSGQSSRM